MSLPEEPYICSMKKWLILFFLTPLCGFAQQIVVQPYLQDAEPTSIWIYWETDAQDQSIVDWGVDSLTLSNQTTGGFINSGGGARIHTVQLTNLQPDSLYYYRATTGSAISPIRHFKTPPLPSQEASIQIIAASDMQIDGGNPNMWDEIVHDGIIDYVQTKYGNNLSENIAMVLIPGDLVATGPIHSQWQTDFFGQADPLFGYVPIYPVLGNHEINTSFFFDYFHLPQNGSAGFEEHWWYKDHSNVRIIGLDSNVPFTTQSQLDWLDSLLTQTCQDPTIDFVFAQLHHPHHSELWPPGNTNYTGEVISLLENFSTNCGKPSIHFFGHTHGYARGQSRDHNHLMVNVASGGGNIDYWGEYAQIDYEEYTRSQDEYGFVVIEVDAGNSPKFTLKRISRGDEMVTLANDLRDSITVYKNNQAPDRPVALYPVNQTVTPDCILLEADAYVEAEGDAHMASHWQVSTDCNDFTNLVYESLKNHENWYNEVDRQAGDVLTDEQLVGLAENANYCWRVRFRDHSLGWSEWSAPVSFATGASAISVNLLTNPGAENDTTDWTVTTGFLESLTSGECNGIAPHTGDRYFAAGALCNEAAFAEAYQAVDLSGYAIEIDTGAVFVHYGGFLTDFNGSDVPEFLLEFWDSTGTSLGTTASTTHTGAGWTAYDKIDPIPVGTRSVHFILRGTRNAGSDNDSYLDDLYLKINPYGCQGSLSNRIDIDIAQPNFTVSPNPVSDEAVISLPHYRNQPWELELIDLQGKIVRHFAGSDGDHLRFSRVGLPAGNYLLRASNGSHYWTRKVIVR